MPFCKEVAMSRLLEGKTAIVTGSGKGLGKAEAIELAKEGAKVTVLARTMADVEKTAQEISSLGGTALPLTCDVREEEQVSAVVRKTVEVFGGVDILVNNAQIMPMPTKIEDHTVQMQKDIWASGYLGTWLFMKECFPYMKGKDSRIINTCSVAGHGILTGFSAYGATKEAIRGLTRTAARDWGEYNIHVNCIAPYGMTPAAREIIDDATMQGIMDQLILKRIGTPEEVGRLVVFLAGPDAAYMTGNTLSIDGGMTMVV